MREFINDKAAVHSEQGHILLTAFEKLSVGILCCTLPNGDQKIFQGTKDGIKADLQFYDWRVLDRIVASGDIGFGEDYVNGLWDSNNLPALLTLFLENAEVLASFFYGQSLYKRIANYLKARSRANTLSGSRANIRDHYDLGNDFYALWLDDSLTYSCALFNADRNLDLQQAQRAKYQRILDKINAAAGDHVLEIGCGWGGFAEQAADRGIGITGVTISSEQYMFASRRLTDKTVAQVKLQDYREIQQQFDHIVSIGMFEHVGEAFWPVYMKKVYDCLKPNGKAMIQTITIHDDLFDRYRKGNDFIRKYIFPGGMLPTETHFKSAAQRAGLDVLDIFRFGHDYAITLEKWLERFDNAHDNVRQLGYSEQFIRKWRFYLSGCQASFNTGRIGVMQVLLTKHPE